MVIPLSAAAGAESGSKAGVLARLLRSGFPVPDGFVVPAEEGRPGTFAAGAEVRGQVARELSRVGEPVTAVRSSAVDEDSADASAAGMYDSILGVRGTDEVVEAIASCRGSADSVRVRDYRRRGGLAESTVTGMTVLVQRLIEADISGVMFTPSASSGVTRIEASWGLGSSVVGGALTPDAFEVGESGLIRERIGVKAVRTDLARPDPDRSDLARPGPGGGLHGTVTTAVSPELQTERTVDDETLLNLASLGARAAEALGSPQDIEWAIADGEIWLVQARPVTAAVPAMPGPGPDSGAHENPRPGNPAALSDHPATPGAKLLGAAGAHGVVTARARIVSGPSAFGELKPGEILVCPSTDPAWTPLFSIASGVVTEVGGVLSHAAIVAREYGIPAVLGVLEARERIATGDLITIDGTSGRVTMA